MKRTPTIEPPTEDCLDAVPPPHPTSPWPFNEPNSEFRLISSLRNAAKTQSPIDILTRACVRLYGVIVYRSEHPQEPNYQPLDYWLGLALADLAVTGRMAYGSFQGAPVTDAALTSATSAKLAGDGVMNVDPAHVAEAAGVVLDRAYDVAWALRGPIAQQAAARIALGWIAVSGENDKPHRPVNLAPPPYEQFETTVTVGGLPPVRTRFFVASAVEDSPPPIAPSRRALPPDPAPLIPPGHRVILFLHGHSSAAEEALTIIPHILAAGLAHDTKYSIVSFDLPNNGYSQSFDHELIAHSDVTSYPSGLVNDTRPVRTPILDYVEEFVVAFVNALDADPAMRIKTRFSGVIGGSLGGNLGLRLGRRDLTVDPWLAAGIVSWSAASVWPPFIENLLLSIGPGRARAWWEAPESETPPLTRTAYFVQVYEELLDPVFLRTTQPETWYRNGWEPCRTYQIRDSRAARREIYDENFRRWHYRLAGEQLIFSHVDHVDHFDKQTPLRYELNNVRQLLIAGEDDEFKGIHIFTNTQKLADLMVKTPGRSLFLRHTGHSMHVERPSFLAGEIVDFLIEGQAALTPDLSFVTSLLLSEPAFKTPDLSFLVPLLLAD